VHKARTFICALLLAGLSAGGVVSAQTAEPDVSPDQDPGKIGLELSLGVSPADIRLEDIVSGMEQVSLSPIVTDDF